MTDVCLVHFRCSMDASP